MSIQDIKIKAMQLLMGASVPTVSQAEQDGTWRVSGVHVSYNTEEEAVKAAEAEQLQNIFISLAEGFELDWGYNGKQIEISIGRQHNDS